MNSITSAALQMSTSHGQRLDMGFQISHDFSMIGKYNNSSRLIAYRTFAHAQKHNYV